MNEVIKSGRKLSKLENLKSSLMYESRGKRYWGAAHGLAGIMNVLLDMELKEDEVEDVKGTLRYMIKNRFSSGNYRTSEGDESDVLVHWCHGAPGVALTLAKAAKVYYVYYYKENNCLCAPRLFLQERCNYQHSDIVFRFLVMMNSWKQQEKLGR